MGTILVNLLFAITVACALVSFGDDLRRQPRRARGTFDGASILGIGAGVLCLVLIFNGVDPGWW